MLADPPPSWLADGYQNGGIQLRFQAWVNQRESDLGKVRSEALRAAKSAFETAEIDGPRPVRYTFTAPLPPAVAHRIAWRSPRRSDGTRRLRRYLGEP